MMTYLVSHPRVSRARATQSSRCTATWQSRTVFYPTMEAIATALGVEVAKAQASTMQERVQLRSLPSKWLT